MNGNIKGTKMAKRIEFVYNKSKDITQIFVWSGMRIVDKLEMPGLLSSYQKKKIREELIKK
jgi:hypothetical protein